MRQLPETGFLRLSDIIGEEEVTPAQAEENREYNKRKEEEAKANGRVDKRGRAIFARRPIRPRPGTPALIPIKKTAWWAGLARGIFPQPVHLGQRVTAWRVEDIRALIESA